MITAAKPSTRFVNKVAIHSRDIGNTNKRFGIIRQVERDIARRLGK